MRGAPGSRSIIWVATGYGVKIYTSVTKELRVGKFRRPVPMSVDVTWEKMVGTPPPLS